LQNVRWYRIFKGRRKKWNNCFSGIIPGGKESFVSTLQRCGKTNQSILSPQKIYAVDLGLRNLFTGFRDKGSLFENYVYNRIKKYQPCYYVVDGYEIDFLLDKKVMIEAKYHSELKGKQLDLFSSSDFQHKFLISSPNQLDTLLTDLSSIFNRLSR